MKPAPNAGGAGPPPESKEARPRPGWGSGAPAPVERKRVARRSRAGSWASQSIGETRVGLLGGTFDPVHEGHLRMAEYAARCCRLERVYFAPAAQPWHKQPPLAGYADRYAMVALALAGRRNWIPVDIPSPRRRPRQSGGAATGVAYAPTYSVDQVSWLRRRHPNERLCFIVGADAFLTLPGWKQYRKLLALCDFAVLGRGGIGWDAIRAVVPASLRAEDRGQEKERGGRNPGGGVYELPLAGGNRLYWLSRFRSAASSTEARRKLARPARPGPGLILPAVASYARRAGLYRTELRVLEPRTHG